MKRMALNKKLLVAPETPLSRRVLDSLRSPQNKNVMDKYMKYKLIFVLLFTFFLNAEAEEPKLIDVYRDGSSHQNDFVILDDCAEGTPLYVDNCYRKLRSQTDIILRNYIADYLQYFLKNQVSPVETDTIFDSNINISQGFRKREEINSDYEDMVCRINSTCTLGSCGTLHSQAKQICIETKTVERTEFLLNELKNGLNIYEGKIDFTVKHLTLETKGFYVQLISHCDLGFYECESVTYTGKSKKSGDKITLEGKPYYGYRKINNRGKLHILGYYFKNSNYEYFVDFSGVLSVVDSNNGKTIFKQDGKWIMNP
jgi:hypothetical protein